MFVKITRIPHYSNLTIGFVYKVEQCEHSPNSLRFVSTGGKFMTLVAKSLIDSGDLAYAEVDAPQVSPLRGWRNDHAAKLWREVYVQRIVDGYLGIDAAATADDAVARFKDRWEGDTFTHNV